MLKFGADPQFLNFVVRRSPSPTNPENFVKNIHFGEKYFSKIWQKFTFLRLGGELPHQNFKKIKHHSRYVCSIFGRAAILSSTFIRKKTVFPIAPQWKGRLITCILSAAKRRATESVDVW